MKMADQVMRLFDSGVRARGFHYFRNKAVDFNELDGDTAFFTVSGTDDYEVSVSYDKKNPQDFDGYCTCPHFDGGDNCKHLWAAILEIDARDIFSMQQPVKAEINKQIPWRQQLEQAQRSRQRDLNERPFYGSVQTKQKHNSRVGTYVIELDNSIHRGSIMLSLFVQERLKSGKLGKLKYAELTSEKIASYEDPLERDFLWDLIGRTEIAERFYSYERMKTSRVFLTTGHADLILRKISATGRLGFRASEAYYDIEDISSYSYQEDIWSFRLVLTKEDKGYQLTGALWNEKNERRPLSEVLGSIEHFVFFNNFCARSDISAYSLWVELLAQGAMFVDDTEIEDFLDYVWRGPGAHAPIDLPNEIQFKDLDMLDPAVRLSFEVDKNSGLFAAKLQFIYGSKIVAPGTGPYIYDMDRKERIRRNDLLEKQVHEKLLSLQPVASEDPAIQGYFAAEDFLSAVEAAHVFGWEVLARDQKVNLGQDFQLSMSSGVDWFDLGVEFQFGQQKVLLPRLLHAIRTNQRMIALDDGTTGILPEAWLQKFAPMIALGKQTEAGLRLSKVQALFFASDLSGNLSKKDGKEFGELLNLLNQLKTLKPVQPSALLQGELRPYQKSGLAWLKTLAENGIGGILADDMGLGKTIQVLALLAKNKRQTPNLVVVPRSLIFNWQSESAKFTPHLKVLIYSGQNRKQLQSEILKHDLILTTYQTLRNDIDVMKDIQFDFLILDEAHYVKNSEAQASMAVKLINARKKIALTGTPVENSLMDLFSILSIVNPGLVTQTQAQKWAKEAQPEKIQSLARALSPFLLRRTKEQVLKDLPEKSEQVLVCELSTQERKRYNELKVFYWNQLTKTVESKGFARSKIEVLEALLRLRQASCHQGLLDEKLAASSSSKFELVLEQLQTVIQDGHKALVFSQFTSLLKLFSNHLHELGIAYEYLDGQTKDRAERVEHFQKNKHCPVFLLSLKAGGVGLNLTAADYVFILDPWWNPAAESQAIDRTHRIGQKNKVFAYKIIAKDTVEEKILELQQKKKNLAKAIISEDSSLLKSLKLDDLKLLFE